MDSNNKKGKILLLGGLGYIGSHIAVDFVGSGYDIVIYDNLSNSELQVLTDIEKITGTKVPFIKGDIRDKEKLSKVFKSGNFEAVIHLAGLKSVGESSEVPIDYFSNNISGTISLLEQMDIFGVKRIIFSSSATVYGSPKYLPMDELHPTSSVNPYGRCKLHVEEILRDVASSDRNWRVVCLRYFNPVGAHHSGIIGDNPKGIPSNLMPYVARVADGNLPYLNIFGNDYNTHDGTGVRDYIHILDLVSGHKSALKFLNNNLGWHAFNLGTGKGYSVLDIVQCLEGISGKKVKFKFSGRRHGDVDSCYSETTKANKILGWSAKYDLDDMCESLWNFQKFKSNQTS